MHAAEKPSRRAENAPVVFTHPVSHLGICAGHPHVKTTAIGMEFNQGTVPSVFVL